MHRNSNTRLEEWASLIGDELPDDIEVAAGRRLDERQPGESVWSGRPDR